MRNAALSRLSLPALCLFVATGAHASLTNYWPVTESSGSTTANAAGGVNGGLFNGASFVNDGVRGQVLNFAGGGQYVNAGSIPALPTASNYTWSFWSNTVATATSTVILGNRYSPAAGVDFSPREFVKFTTSQFEWHVNAAGQNLNYPDMAVNTWTHTAVVKQGPLMISYRNGVVNGTNIVTAGTNNPQPLYFGGDQNSESWAGRIDDIGTWNNAMPGRSIVGLATGAYTPATAPVVAAALPTLATNSFISLAGWAATNRGLENNAPSGYNAPALTGGAVSLSGTTTTSYWYGSSLESLTDYDATKSTEIAVDRISLSGSGTAYRSSLWILGDNDHYMHFSQNAGEGGWTWNSRDVGGAGTLGDTGVGNNLILLDSLDSDLGNHRMSISLEPVGAPGSGDVNMYLYLDGTLAGAQGFTNFPSTFKVVLTGQGRFAGDSVDARFDNLAINQIPEPAATATLALAGLALLRRRRK